MRPEPAPVIRVEPAALVSEPPPCVCGVRGGGGLARIPLQQPPNERLALSRYLTGLGRKRNGSVTTTLGQSVVDCTRRVRLRISISPWSQFQSKLSPFAVVRRRSLRLGSQTQTNGCERGRAGLCGVGKRVGFTPSRIRISYPPPLPLGETSPALRSRGRSFVGGPPLSKMPRRLTTPTLTSPGGSRLATGQTPPRADTKSNPRGTAGPRSTSPPADGNDRSRQRRPHR